MVLFYQIWHVQLFYWFPGIVTLWVALSFQEVLQLFLLSKVSVAPFVSTLYLFSPIVRSGGGHEKLGPCDSVSTYGVSRDAWKTGCMSPRHQPVGKAKVLGLEPYQLSCCPSCVWCSAFVHHFVQGICSQGPVVL